MPQNHRSSQSSSKPSLQPALRFRIPSTGTELAPSGTEGCLQTFNLYPGYNYTIEQEKKTTHKFNFTEYLGKQKTGRNAQGEDPTFAKDSAAGKFVPFKQSVLDQLDYFSVVSVKSDGKCVFSNSLIETDLQSLGRKAKSAVKLDGVIKFLSSDAQVSKVSDDFRTVSGDQVTSAERREKRDKYVASSVAVAGAAAFSGAMGGSSSSSGLFSSSGGGFFSGSGGGFTF